MCEHLDLGGGNFGIICGTRSRPKFCACGRQAIALCDWKVPSRESGTCDAPICAQHAMSVARGKDLCPAHQQAWEEWKKRHPAPQGNLFTEQSR